MPTERGVLDWDDLTPEDQDRAMQLMTELNDLFKKYDVEEPESCEDST